jgi:hypothetical protein
MRSGKPIIPCNGGMWEISWIVLNSVQEPVDRAFATSPYTRVGD